MDTHTHPMDEAAHIEQIRFELSHLLATGTPVAIHLTGFTLFRARTRMEELGISERDTTSTRYAPGIKHMLDRAWRGPLDHLENRFRTALQQYSLQVDGFYPWRFVVGKPLPVDAPEDVRQIEAEKPYARFLALWDELQADLQAWKDGVLAQYDDLYAACRDDFTARAERAYDAMRLSDPLFDEARDAFIARVVTRSLARFPSRASIQDGIQAERRTGAIQNITEIRQQQQAAEEQALRTRMLALDLGAEERRVAALRLAELEEARRQARAMVSPFAQVFAQIGQQLLEGTHAIKTMIDTYGYVPGKTVQKAKRLREIYDLFHVQDNAALERALADLDAVLVPATGKRTKKKGETTYDAVAIHAALLEIEQTVKATSAEMTTPDYSGYSALEVEEAPTFA